MTMRITNKWLRHRIEHDSDLDTDAGMPITKIDVLRAFVPEVAAQPAQPARVAPTSRASLLLGRLLRQLRRRDSLDLSRLAAEARVPESELRALEEDPDVVPRPRTIYQLATYFKVSSQALLTLSPAAAERDPELDEAAVRFAASSDALSKLSREERKSLNEFVKMISDYQEHSTDGKR